MMVLSGSQDMNLLNFLFVEYQEMGPVFTYWNWQKQQVTNQVFYTIPRLLCAGR